MSKRVPGLRDMIRDAPGGRVARAPVFAGNSHGTPDGPWIIEKSNWTGIAVMAPRSEYPKIRGRDELLRPGVYLLWGPGDSGSRVYVGEADEVRSRLDQHHRNKDFWTKLVVFSSKDENLNKAHVRYLESRLIQRAHQAKRAEVEDGNVTQLPRLSESDRADVETFLANLLVIVPLLNLDAFDLASAEGDETSPRLLLNERGARGEGREVPDEFLVYKDSVARAVETPSAQERTRESRRILIERGVLLPSADGLRFVEDYRFDSPSSAAGVLVGGSSNGRKAWKDANGTTLRELQERSVS